MSITENKVITRYTADVSQETAALDALMRKIDQLKAKETQAAQAREQHFDQLVLDMTRANNSIEDSAMSWDGLTKKTATFGETIQRAATGIQSVSKAMAPWNQALELGGKLVNFASEAMDAYGKTSAGAALEVKQLKEEFSKYKEEVMAGAGLIAVALLKPVGALEEQRKAMLRIEHLDSYKRFFDGKGKLRDLRTGDFTEEELAFAREGVDFGMGIKVKIEDRKYGPIESMTRALGTMREELAKSGDAWDTTGQKFIDGLTHGLDEVSKKGSKASIEAARLRSELEAYKTLRSATMFFDFDAPAAQLRGGLGVAADTTVYNAYGTPQTERELLDRINRQSMAQYNTEQFKSQLPGYGADWLAAETAALEKFGEVAANAYEIIAGGSGSVTKILKDMARQQLLALGKVEVVEAARQIGLGFGALANPLTAGAAAMHFTSAAKHGVAAALAGAGAYAVGSIGGGSSGGGGGASSSAGISSGGASFVNGQQQTVTNYYIVGDNHAEDSPRIKQRNAQRTMALATSRTSAGRAE